MTSAEAGAGILIGVGIGSVPFLIGVAYGLVWWRRTGRHMPVIPVRPTDAVPDTLPAEWGSGR